jgi:hypothetical protein
MINHVELVITKVACFYPCPSESARSLLYDESADLTLEIGS